MGNMDATQRTQTERAELGDASSQRMLRARSNRGPLIYTLLALPLLGVLIYAVVAGIDEWWQALVLGVIVLTTIGLMIAVDPNRPRADRRAQAGAACFCAFSATSVSSFVWSSVSGGRGLRISRAITSRWICEVPS